ncbi:MAG: ATP-dependent DNA helicase RecG [Bacteroidales bacterium]
MQYDILQTEIEYLKGVGPKRAEVLKKELSIYRFHDLLHYFPFRYVDKTRFYKISEIGSVQSYVQLKGNISRPKMIGAGRGQRMTAVFNDDTGTIELVWFKGFKFLKDKFLSSKKWIVYGKPTNFGGSFNIVHPDIEEFDAREVKMNERFEGVYNSTEKMKNIGLNTKGINKVMKNLIAQVGQAIPENLSDSLLQSFGLLSRAEAFHEIHFPSSQESLQQAQIRLKFEELFYIQLQLLLQKRTRYLKNKGLVFSNVGDYFLNFYNNSLPFELTGAQKRVIKEIRNDTRTGHQMNRLVQGDVGSGKTLVALMCMLLAIDNGAQSCLMAPTEILANQHFNGISKFLKELDIDVRLLTGSTRAKERRVLHEDLESGKVQILIGTHALIEDKVQFKNLGLVVIDEQHRFGVEQRAKLWKKNLTPPHILVMTATPIPRTLAMSLYGDLDISVIDELPPGRKPIKTMHAYESKRLRVFGFMREQIQAGRQIYVVYPLIDESEKLDLKNLMEGYEAISRAFPLPEYRVSVVHGKMNAADKDHEMQRFARGETQIMVATTVIEVGVDVPNATVMVIENTERFGLSQLHQLRGRVGRGGSQSYCILMSSYKLSSDSKKRIEIMVGTNDGFVVAQEDLKLRGPGDIQGTKQSGTLNLRIADIIKDERLMKMARDAATAILEEDANLKLGKNTRILGFVKLLRANKTNWSVIS